MWDNQFIPWNVSCTRDNAAAIEGVFDDDGTPAVRARVISPQSRGLFAGRTGMKLASAQPPRKKARSGRQRGIARLIM
jgi:hypothetical protein